MAKFLHSFIYPRSVLNPLLRYYCWAKPWNEWCVFILQVNKWYSGKKGITTYRSPDEGIEPSTTRLKVERSSNWANRVTVVTTSWKSWLLWRYSFSLYLLLYFFVLWLCQWTRRRATKPPLHLQTRIIIRLVSFKMSHTSIWPIWFD